MSKAFSKSSIFLSAQCSAAGLSTMFFNLQLILTQNIRLIERQSERLRLFNLGWHTHALFRVVIRQQVLHGLLTVDLVQWFIELNLVINLLTFLGLLEEASFSLV